MPTSETLHLCVPVSVCGLEALAVPIPPAGNVKAGHMRAPPPPGKVRGRFGSTASPLVTWSAAEHAGESRRHGGVHVSLVGPLALLSTA